MEQHEKRTQAERELLQLKQDADSISRCCRLVVIIWLAYGLFSIAVFILWIITGEWPLG